MQQKEVIVIGSGLTGLTTAHYLNKAEIDFHVFDQMERHGGVISTEHENGFTYENGPNTGVVGTAEVVDLFEDLKEYCELEVANDKVNKRYILKKGKWEKLPSGLLEGIKTPLFSTKDKLRILGEPFRSRGKNPHENLSRFVIRRLGKSILDFAVDPFILGVYAGDPDYLVPKYALPKLYNLEQNYGSFIGGSIKKSFEKKDEQAKKITRKVFSAKGGLSNLTNALYSSSGFKNFSFGIGNIQISTENGHYVLRGEKNNQKIEVATKQIISTTGSFALPALFPFIQAEDMMKLSNLKYAKVIEVVLGFKNWTGIHLDGFGGLIPFKEQRKVLGYLFLSSFLEDKAPKNGALITIFMGGMRKEELTSLSDNEIFEIVERETIDLMQISEFKPDLVKINRYEHAIPQYGADSGIRFKTIEKLQNEHPGLQIGGNLRNGIGMADRIKQGKDLAFEAIRQYKSV